MALDRLRSNRTESTYMVLYKNALVGRNPTSPDPEGLHAGSVFLYGKCYRPVASMLGSN